MIIKPIIKSFTKITILTLVFFVILYLWSSIAQAWWWSSDKSSENIDNFVSIENYWLSEVWVALNINVWIKFYEQKAKENSSFYNDIVPIYTMKSDRNITNDILITKNVDSLRDYLNVTKINIKWYLDSGWERKDNYDSLMNQLKIRYKTWYANSKNLNTQIESIISHLEELDASITNIKESMSLNLKNYNAPWLNKNLNDYITIKNEITLMKVYVIFCNRFLSYYNLLNNYTKNTITTLRLNEDAIVKNSFIVVPNQWSELITKLNLVYNENDLTTTQNVNTTSTLDENIADISNQESSSFSYSSLNFDTDYSIDNSNNNWIFWDPFNLNWSVETIKQTWKIDFWAPNYINNN
jgi:hypothetical protein